MKKILTFSLAFALLVMGSAAYADVDRVGGSWTLNAPSGIDFSCGGGTYSHMLDAADQDEAGDFTGTGYYIPNDDYTWDVDGNISEDDITFTIVYTGNNAGYTLNMVGTIAPDGSISGDTDGNCQTFSMPAGSASRFEGNHGQYVKSQEDKKTAAQSRVGMPVKSKGHK